MGYRVVGRRKYRSEPGTAWSLQQQLLVEMAERCSLYGDLQREMVGLWGLNRLYLEGASQSTGEMLEDTSAVPGFQRHLVAWSSALYSGRASNMAIDCRERLALQPLEALAVSG